VLGAELKEGAAEYVGTWLMEGDIEKDGASLSHSVALENDGAAA
jgi:hypothetical protein